MGTINLRFLAIATLTAAAVAVGSLSYLAYQSSPERDSNDDNDIDANEPKKPETKDCINNLTENERIALGNAAKIRGNKFFHASQLKEASQCYTEAISYYPESHKETSLAYANRAACNLTLKNYELVISDCTKALSYDPYFIKALDRRAKAYEMTSNLEEALIDLTTICIINDFKTNEFVERLEKLLKQQSVLKSSQLWKPRQYVLPAKWQIQEFLASFPTDLIELNERAKSSQSLKDASAALQGLEYSIADEQFKVMLSQLNSFEPETQALILEWNSIFEFMKGNMEAAFKYGEDALKLAPTCQTQLIRKALIFLEQNNIEAMISIFTHDIDFTNKPNPASFYHRAEVMALMGNLELSLNDFKKCIDLDPYFINAYVHLARCYIGLDQITEAEKLIQKGLSLSPHNKDLTLCRAEILVLSGKVSEAQTLFNNVINAYPTCPQAYLSLAMASINKSDNKADAENYLLQALQLDPNFQAAHLQLAHLQTQSEHLNDRALEHFNKAIELSKNIQEMEAIVSLREASIAQNAVCNRYPELKAKLL